MPDIRVHLDGFIAHTTEWLKDYFKCDEYISGTRAMGLLAELRVEPDEHFPGGKWATIQHLEYCIAHASDEDPVLEVHYPVLKKAIEKGRLAEAGRPDPRRRKLRTPCPRPPQLHEG